MQTWLIAEDEADIRNLVAMMCQVWGHDPLVFENGQKVWDWLDKVETGDGVDKLPEFVLMDIRMPGKFGSEIAQRMRSLPQLNTTPIVLMTAFSISEDERADMMTRTGVDHILNKPLPDFESLRVTLHSIMDRKQNQGGLMTNSDRPSTPPDVSGAIGRVNRLGLATERLFSRLYRGLGRRSQQKADLALQQYDLPPRDEEIERLTGILNSIDEGVIMQDNEGRIVMVNAAARDLIGNQKAFWESDLGTMFLSAQRQFDPGGGELVPMTEPTRVPLNNRVIGAQIAAVSDSHGQRIGTMMVLRDVTRDAISDRLKDQFILSISHELRTPMTVIKGMSEVIMEQTGQAPNRRLLETLSRNVDILDRMVVELLDISELSAGSFAVRQDALDFEALLWSVVNGLTPEVRRAGLDVAVIVRDTPRLRLAGDEQRLRWAFGHLLQNAVRYTESGGHIIVTVRHNPETDQIAVQVVDTGVGISEKDLPHIFERFYRGEARTNDGRLLDPRGLGQGLFIARTVLEAHGGYLSVRSQAGGGSIFTAALPGGD